MHGTLDITELEVPRTAAGGNGKEPPDSEVISFKLDDWKWLQIHREYVKNNPDDFLTKRIYNNYLRWYKNN